MDVAEVLRGAGSVARTRTLLERGVGRGQLARGVAAGELLRLRRGVIALPDASPAFTAAVMNNGLLTCASAAEHYGLWLLHPPATHHVSCLDGYSGQHTNHELRTVAVHGRLPLVGPLDVLLHALHCLPELDAVVMVESAVRRGWEVRPALRRRLLGPRNGKARAALERVTGCADSAIEVVARLLFLDAGISIQTQFHLAGVGRVDFLLEGFLVVEIDGAAFHSDRRALRRDRQRNNLTVLGGYLVLRFCYEDIMFDRETVLEQVWRVLSGRVTR